MSFDCKDIEDHLVIHEILGVGEGSGNGGGGDAKTGRICFSTTQTDHGYPVGPATIPVYKDAVSGWIPAQADNAETLAVGLINEVFDADSFEVTLAGRTTIIGHGLIPLEYYFLDVETAGALTISTPISGIVQPILWVEDSDTVIVTLERPNELSEEPEEILGRVENLEINVSGLQTQVSGLEEFTEQFDNVIEGSGDTGQVAFFTTASGISGDSNLYWDDTNKRLGLGTNVPNTFGLDLSVDTGPHFDTTYSLGSVSKRFESIYLDKLHLNSLTSETSVARDWIATVDKANALGNLSIQEGSNLAISIHPSGFVGVNTIETPEALNVSGVFALYESNSPTATENHGKLYTSVTDKRLHFVDENGFDYDLVLGEAGTSTLGSIVLSVDSGGSDAPSTTRPPKILQGDYSSEPFATPQAALDSLPTHQSHTVTINISSGSFPGFVIQNGLGLNNPSTTAQADPPFKILGAQGQVTPTTGPASGNASSGTSTTLTLTSAGWTINDFAQNKAYYINLTGGTGAGQKKLIRSNTSDTITIAGTFSPIPDGTTTFEIVENQTVLNSANSNSSIISIEQYKGSIELRNIHIDDVATTYSVSIQNTSRIQLDNLTFSGNDFGLSCNYCEDIICDLLGINNTSVIAISATNNLRNIVLTDLLINNGVAGVRIDNSSYSSINGSYVGSLSAGDAFNINRVQLVELKKPVINSVNTGIRSTYSCIEIDSGQISNCSIEPFNLIKAYVKTLNSLSGTGNNGYGVRTDRMGCEFEVLAFVPTLTGASGDATVDNVLDLTWSGDFANDGDAVVNNSTGARIARTI